MEFARYEMGPLDGDVSGQVAIGPAHPRQRVTRDRGVKVNNLHEPMHACISQPAAAARRARRTRADRTGSGDELAISVAPLQPYADLGGVIPGAHSPVARPDAAGAGAGSQRSAAAPHGADRWGVGLSDTDSADESSADLLSRSYWCVEERPPVGGELEDWLRSQGTDISLFFTEVWARRAL